MECFIIKDGTEHKAELEDILPLIGNDPGFQKILNMPYNFYYLDYSNIAQDLAFMPYVIKEVFYRNVSSRISSQWKKKVNAIESTSEKDSASEQRKLANLMGFLNKHWEHLRNPPKSLTWKENKDESLIKRIEKACVSGEFSIGTYLSDEKLSEIDVREAFATFQNRREELAKIHTLSITGNMLPIAISFLETKNIKKLSISGNLTELPVWIHETISLCSLSVNNTNITTLPDWIGDLQSLTELYLRNNNILQTLPDTIGNLQSLTKLSFDNCKSLIALPDSIGKLQSLMELSLNGSYRLMDLPDVIGNLKSLTKLSLDANFMLRALPESIGNLQSLAELSLDNSFSIQVLPDSIGNLQSLTRLSLDSNLNLQTLPDSIGNLRSLTWLSLCNILRRCVPDDFRESISNVDVDNLKTLPDSIGNLQSLETLMLYCNHNLKTLPNTIGNLKSLTELTLYGLNSLQSLPDSIGNLQSLTKLTLNGNKNLKTLPETIGNLKNVTFLDLRYSSIEQLPDSISNLSTLKHVDIRGTNIQSIPGFFSSLETFINNKQVVIIPEEDTLPYRSFANSYYTLVETLTRFSKKARREGILALEEEIEDCAGDNFFKIGLRLTVDGTDGEIIRDILTPHIEREHDFYRKKLKEIALEGILGIHDGVSYNHLLMLLNSVDIKNNPIDAACTKYFTGDINAFSDIDFKAYMQPEEEREEISFIKRAMELSEISRREGFLALEKHLDFDGITAHDVFEYGLPMLIDGYESKFIDTVLNKFVEHQIDPVQKNFALAKKGAVLSIQAEDNPRILITKLLAYFDKSIARAAEEEILRD
jgi:Leucine-rich repeat (LRR) protein/flagellar motor component MotA